MEVIVVKKIISLMILTALILMSAGCDNSPENNEINSYQKDTKNSESSGETSRSNSLAEESSKKEESSQEEPSKKEPSQEEASQKEASQKESSQKDYTKEKAEGGFTDDDLLIVKQDDHWRAMKMFVGGSGDSYVKGLNTLREKLDDSVNIYSMPVPTACEFYTPSSFSDYYVSQEKCFSDISKRLSKDIKSIDICSVLKKHTEEHIYSRTDHHWQPLGAYYAAEAFAKAAGVPYNDISKYYKVTDEDYIGTLYTFSGDDRLKNDPEKFTYYKPKERIPAHYYDKNFGYQYEGELIVLGNMDNSYSRFLGGDSNSVKLMTGVNNGRKLLVIKDSFGNAEIPFYVGSFEEIYVLDIRDFKKNIVNFVNDLGITDVLFTMAGDSVVGSNADNLDNLITQAQDIKIIDKQPTAYLD